MASDRTRLAPAFIGRRMGCALVLLLGGVSGGRAEDGNLLLNPDFEKPALAEHTESERLVPEHWRVFSNRPPDTGADAAVSVTRGMAFPNEGQQCLLLEPRAEEEFHVGIYQNFAPKPQRTLEYTVYIKAVPERPLTGATRGQISIEWIDAGGSEIERSWGPSWAAPDLPPAEWKPFKLVADAPPDAVTARAVVTAFGDIDGGGAFAVDNTSVQDISTEPSR